MFGVLHNVYGVKGPISRSYYNKEKGVKKLYKRLTYLVRREKTLGVDSYLGS